MKKIFLLFFVLLFTSRVNSQIFMEDFEYPANTPLSSTPQWFIASDSGENQNYAAIPGLTFPGYIGSGIGNTGYLTAGTGEDDYALLTSSVNSGAVYVSFMLNALSVANPADVEFLTLQGTDIQTYASLATDGQGSTFKLGISKTSGGGYEYTSQNLNLFHTYLIIVKYEFKTGSGNDDEVSLFVFDNTDPLPSIEPAPTVGPTTTSGSPDAPNLNRLFLPKTSISNPDTYIDGIYVDQSWNNNVLPVELASFTSSVNRRDVKLSWSTASETNNSGFEIERSSETISWQKIGVAAGNGTTASVSNYTFIDNGLSTGTYNYRLKQIDFNGNFEYYNLSNEVNIGIPSGYDLSQNYPNPFNPSTSINFDIPEVGNVSLKLFDLSGKEVGTIINEVKTAGYYTVNYNASSLPSGMYFYTLQSNNFSATKKMMLIK